MLAIITGASKGIGRAIAEKFAQNGFDLAICARNLDNLLILKEDLEGKYKIKVKVAAIDVSVKSDLIQFAKQFLNQKVDILVNNAGVFVQEQLHTEPDGTLERLIETNVYSAYYLTKKILPSMLKHQQGHIFNICSVASQMAYPQGGAYSVSKFALLGFSKSLREELKHQNIKVTAILAGATLTDSWQGSGLAPERFVQPSDVADSIWAAYQLSDSALIEEMTIRPQLGDI